MSTFDSLKKAIRELQIGENDRVPPHIYGAHKHALTSFLHGKWSDALQEMLFILQYYQQKQEHLPTACERLYYTLLVNVTVTSANTLSIR
jgi:hypothetical protein